MRSWRICPLELRCGERPLREEAQIGFATDELSFALKRGKRDDEVRDLLVGDRKTLTLGLDKQDLVLHQLAEDEVVEAELAHEVGGVLGAELLPVLLFLRSIAPQELLRRDGRAFDPGHFSGAGRTRRIEEVGNIEGDEGQNDEDPRESLPRTSRGFCGRENTSASRNSHSHRDGRRATNPFAITLSEPNMLSEASSAIKLGEEGVAGPRSAVLSF